MGESAATREVRQRYGVPDGVLLRVEPDEVLACLPGYEVAVREVAAHPDALPPSHLGGRARLSRLPSPHGAVVVREYRKGGHFRRVRAPGLRGAWRPLEELVLHRRLAALGVPVADAVGCVVLRGRVGWRGFLLLREVKDGTDLEAWLHGVEAVGRPDPRTVLREAGRAVRRLHDAGIPHPDLHPKNLLCVPGGAVLVLDLDKAHAQDGVLDDATRLRNLVRLGRAIEKHRLKGIRAGRREALRFLEGYAGSPEAARLWFDRIRARLRRGLRLRVLWWRLLGEARPWRPVPGAEA
ncbi:MAG: lipopolysaccharide kinase InaA family protein [Planctomycetota bacterium]